jgi:hypothetical protein
MPTVAKPVPVKATSTGLTKLVALCVMVKACEETPATVGEKANSTESEAPGVRRSVPPPLFTEKGAERLPIFPSRIPAEEDKFVIVRVWVTDSPTTTFPKLTGTGLMDILIKGPPTPVIGTLRVVPGTPFGALCVMVKLSENDPRVGGEKFTTTCVDFPGCRLKDPPPFTKVKGLERFATFPSKVPVEEIGFVIVITLLADWPTATLPKFIGLGFTAI